MPQKEITLPRKLVNDLLQHAQSTPDVEVCGFISAINGAAEKSYPIKNISNLPENHFLMDPEQQLKTTNQIKDSETEELFAIYHSHPTSEARPSLQDVEQAPFEELYYLIISLNTKGVLEMRCFHLSHDENILEARLTMSEE